MTTEITTTATEEKVMVRCPECDSKVSAIVTGGMVIMASHFGYCDLNGTATFANIINEAEETVSGWVIKPGATVLVTRKTWKTQETDFKKVVAKRQTILGRNDLIASPFGAVLSDVLDREIIDPSFSGVYGYDAADGWWTFGTTINEVEYVVQIHQGDLLSAETHTGRNGTIRYIGAGVFMNEDNRVFDTWAWIKHNELAALAAAGLKPLFFAVDTYKWGN